MEPAGRFRHEALFYQEAPHYVADTARYVREGLAAGESVLVAVVEEHARSLREELGADAARVEFLDMAQVGRNPARLIPAWQEWVERNTARGTAFRGVGEPVWAGRSELEIRECLRHEHLLNTAFENGPEWGLLCPYDRAHLPREVIEDVARTHPGSRGALPAVDGEACAVDGGREALDAEPPDLGPPLFSASFGVEALPWLRTAIRERADQLGLYGRDVADFVLVADELACNSVRHGGGHGRMELWAQDGHAVCEVRDEGLISDPLVGRRRPALTAEGGAGLWTANQVCDLLLIHSTPASGTAVRAYLPT
ncbi:anti-sigma factor RsbA family regulatory protein [Actinospica robiniae]|uniref:anti-sigma factor RsbA family regulatory protein n=1 Tax=Actinospica robiniae TaxID=304901 RepID=UPI000402A3E2|nr:anti-sigma factor RsbA family regulatory protein [Actinospica robiniae]